jgi:hypothetical protein
MKFYPESGMLEVAGLVLMRHVNIPSMIEKSGLKWEDFSYNGEHAGRLVFDLSRPDGKKTETILVVCFNRENGEILGWFIGPTVLPDNGSQGSKKRGIKKKLARENKELFEKETGVLLPVKGKWGKIFVSCKEDPHYGPHNPFVDIACHYKEWT